MYTGNPIILSSVTSLLTWIVIRFYELSLPGTHPLELELFTHCREDRKLLHGISRIEKLSIKSMSHKHLIMHRQRGVAWQLHCLGCTLSSKLLSMYTAYPASGKVTMLFNAGFWPLWIFCLQEKCHYLSSLDYRAS